MSDQILFETDRLIIRNWRDDDKPVFAKMMADPIARTYFPDLMTQEYAYNIVDSDREMIAEKKYGWCAAELRQTGEFVGMIGLMDVDDTLPFHTPGMLEIGWYLDPAQWGKGLATEGANGMLNYLWSTFGLPEVVAFTATINTPSRAVMERIGMVYEPENDFEHPKVEDGHRVKPHVFYRLKNPTKKGR